jgi:TfoX/Sxy family transcriptional regulator of competence genes
MAKTKAAAAKPGKKSRGPKKPSAKRPLNKSARARAMPTFTKPPNNLVETFTRAITQMGGVESRRMFGYPAAFTNTQMFASLFQDQMILRLTEADRAALAAKGGRPFEPMPGRSMREYMTVPDGVRESPPALREWLAKAQAYASSLPPKKKR